MLDQLVPIAPPTISGVIEFPRPYPLWSMLRELKSRRFVDLTHTFGPGIPHAVDFEDERRTTISSYEADGYLAHRYEHVGQWGTHVDPPAHFVEGGRFLDEIRVEEMVLPLVIFDATLMAAQDPDYCLSRDDVLAWEKRNGRVPDSALAVLKTGWSTRWPSECAMKNVDEFGVSHTPGWSVSALRFLCDERNIGALGHETIDTDPGALVSRHEYPAEKYLLQQDRYQLELLTNLDNTPEAGAIAIATFAKPQNGSGFPARVFAIVP